MDSRARSTPGGVEIEDLLAERDWLVRISRRLVADAGQVDDVVQEALARAIAAEEARGSVRSARSWLAGIVRNVAAEGRRSEARRRFRERDAAIPDARAAEDLDPARIQSRAEYRALVAAQLLQLPPDQGEVLALRFYEGLSAAEIGRRTGVRPAAVRQRVRRAVAALRRQLDRLDEGGHDGGWRAIALPLALEGLGAGGQGARFVVGIGALLLGAAALLWPTGSPARPVGGLTPGADRRVEGESRANAAALGEVTATDVDGHRAPAVAAPPAQAPPGSRLRVTLVDGSSGEPAVGVSWRLLRTGLADPGGALVDGAFDAVELPEPEPLARGVTDASGSILHVGPPDTLLDLIVERSERFARASVPLDLERGGLDHRVVLGPGATLRLRFVDPGGAPAAGVALARETLDGALEVIAESDRTGRVVAPRLAVLPRAFVRAGRNGPALPDREVGERLVAVPAGAVVDGRLHGPRFGAFDVARASTRWSLGDVEVPAETVVTGRVLDEDGWPVSGAIVTWRRDTFFERGRSRGRLRLRPGGQARIATPARHGEALSGPGGRFELRFRRALDSRVKVAALGGDGRGGVSRWILGEGVLEASGVEVVLGPTVPPVAPERRVAVSSPAADSPWLDAFQRRDRRVTCRVVDDATGAALRRAAIRVTPIDGPGRENGAPMLSGRAVVRVEWDAVNVEISAPGYRSERRSGEGLAPDAPLELGEIRLRRAAPADVPDDDRES